MKHLARFAVPAILALCCAPLTAGGERTAFSAAAPQQLRAVGKLTVPGSDRVAGERRHRDENCSAALVAPRTILTAWHCLEYYNDLSREPLFSLPHAPGQQPVPARRLADGGGMDADWALLRLAQPITDIAPLAVVPLAGGQVLVAGYARDDELGRGGATLTWQAGCRLVDTGPRGVATDCVTYKGASGGVVMSGGGIVGVISAGDGTAQTWFAPSSGFIDPLRAHAR